MAQFSNRNPAPSVAWLREQMLPAALHAAGFHDQAHQLSDPDDVRAAAKTVASYAAEHIPAKGRRDRSQARTPAQQGTPMSRARQALGPTLFDEIEAIREEHPRTGSGPVTDACRTVLICAAMIDRDGSQTQLTVLRFPARTLRPRRHLEPACTTPTTPTLQALPEVSHHEAVSIRARGPRR